VRKLPARVCIRDLSQLLGLVAGLVLLRMQQVVDEQQGRADDKRCRCGAPVEPEMRQSFDARTLSQRSDMAPEFG
jgi:hypothetical protein